MWRWASAGRLHSLCAALFLAPYRPPRPCMYPWPSWPGRTGSGQPRGTGQPPGACCTQARPTRRGARGVACDWAVILASRTGGVLVLLAQSVGRLAGSSTALHSLRPHVHVNCYGHAPCSPAHQRWWLGRSVTALHDFNCCTCCPAKAGWARQLLDVWGPAACLRPRCAW